MSGAGAPAAALRHVERVLGGRGRLRGRRESGESGAGDRRVALQHPDRLPSVHVIGLPQPNAAVVAGRGQDRPRHVPRHAPHLVWRTETKVLAYRWNEVLQEDAIRAICNHRGTKYIVPSSGF